MSQENVELVRGVVQSFNERDVDAFLASHTDDVVFRLFGGFADLLGPEFRGHEGLRRLFDDWVENLRIQVEMETILEGGGRAVVIFRVMGAGGRSGAPATTQAGQVYSFRDGQISAVDSCWEATEALEAVGLSEQDAHSDS
jgi:ketosteroid isomerase-like protein